MTKTLVERLREESERLSGRSLDRGCQDSGIAANLAENAADEISRLRSVLYQIIDLDHHNMGPESKATKFARAALNDGAHD